LIPTIVALIGLSAPANPANPPEILEQGYGAMYSLDFDRAHGCFQEWERQHPEDPFGPVSDAAAFLFFELDRMKILRSDFFVEDRKLFHGKIQQPDPQAKSGFEKALQRSEQLSGALLKRDPASQGAMFATVMRLALHADYSALIEKQYWQSLNEIKEARNGAEALVAKYPECKDAYLAVGVENYLLGQKPGPVRLLLRMTGAQTDKETGIAKLRIVAEQGHYWKPYAKILLAVAALRADRKDEARKLMGELTLQFPRNDLFRVELKKLSCGGGSC
jgi:hypothetical protein